MKKMITAAMTLMVVFGACAAQADTLTISIQEVGSDVVATVSGSVDIAALTALTTDAVAYPGIGAQRGWVSVGGEPGTNGARGPYLDVDKFGNLTWDDPEATLGAGVGSDVYPDVATGDLVQLLVSGYVYVEDGYVSGTALSGTATWLNHSMTTLGLTATSFSATYGTDNSVEVFVGVPVSGGGDPVPEPATLSLLGLGLAGMAARRMRRKAD